MFDWVLNTPLRRFFIRKIYGILKIIKEKIVVESLKPATAENHSRRVVYKEICRNF